MDDLKLPKHDGINLSKLSREQFDNEIQKGFDDLENGRVTEADQVEKKFKRKYNL